MDEFRRAGMAFDLTDSGPEDGEVVVLLHGYPENRTSWDRVRPFLNDAGFRTVAPDQRGYSPRARPARRRDYVISELVADTLALVDAIGAERVHLVGHDWGGAVGWAFASTHPDRVATLTSLTTPHPAAMTASLLRSSQLLHSWYVLLFQLPVLPELAYRPQADALLRRALLRSGLDADAVQRYLPPLQQPGAARAALNWYRAVPFSRGSVGRITVPTLYVYATDDAFLTRAAADRTAAYVDAPYRYEVLEGMSHWLPEQAPEVVARLVVERARG